MKKYILILSVLLSSMVQGQKVERTNTHKGEVSFGVRTTESLFSESGNYFGLGAGWQFRIRISDKSNTEWFADWITTDIGGLGHRYDAHIGESVIIYPGKRISEKKRFTPYVLGGFCGDYTKVESNYRFDEHTDSYGRQSKERWSFATQLGLGTHYNITERLDVSLSTQYVLHFGKDIHSEIESNHHGEDYLHIHEDDEGGLEGHLFITLSVNFVVFDLIKKS